MKLLTVTLAAAFFAATAGAVYAGEGGGCDWSSTKKQITAETLLPAPDAPSAGS